MNPLWADLAVRAKRSLTEAQGALLSRYLDLLLEANKTMNLTRITDRAQAEVQHIADALTLLPFLPTGRLSIADIGSGGGVPGIPLAIALPDARILLIESTKKKATFLRSAVKALELKNVEVEDKRVEELGHGGRRGKFDVVTARAVGVLPWLIEWGIPLVRKGGWVLAMKGVRAQDEVTLSKRACRLLHAAEPTIEPAPLPGSEGHVVVRIVKLGPTSATYPRGPTATQGKHL